MTNPALAGVRALILDMDGVLWTDTEPIGDLPRLFAQMQELGLKAILATNNATRTVEMYQEKLRGFGVAIDTWQLVNAAHATASYLQRLFPQGGPIYIFGSRALQEVLNNAGFSHSYKAALAVVVGMDREVTYEKLVQATLCIRRGLPFYATTPDRTFPTPAGLVPGTGALLAALEAASDRSAIVCGKPSPEMYEIALERLGYQPGNVLVVGDRAETDIAGAQAIGCRTALVLSGVSSPERAASWQPAPDLVSANLESVLEALKKQ